MTVPEPLGRPSAPMLISARMMLPAERKRSLRSCHPAWYGSCRATYQEQLGIGNTEPYVSNIELISRVGARSEIVVVGWTRWRRCVQTLSCHCHTYLTGHGSCTEPRLVLAVLVDGIRPMPRDIKYNAHFTNENWAAQKGLLRELTNGSLTVFLRSKLHDTADFH
jgi:hypothetical protein